MGEAIIARGQTAAKNVLDDIPVSGDYCSILVVLKDSAGQPCENTKINCKDGTRWYNYTTNEAGMALFKCNSGAANISANNWINGVRTFDQDNIPVLNIDGPVGTKMLKEIKFSKNSKFYRADSGWYNGQFRTIDRINNLIVIGGGGGGGRGSEGEYDSRYSANFGGGGGGGAKNFSSYIDISKNQLYNLYIGAGGGGGGLSTNLNNNGGSGSTSLAFGLSANGGQGGIGTIFSGNGGQGGIGLYNGGNGGKNHYYSNSSSTNGTNGAGGGGGSGCGTETNVNITASFALGKNNGGGNGGKISYYTGVDMALRNGQSGSKGSGGGGGGGSFGGYYTNSQGFQISAHSYGGAGGSGRIEFDM